MKRKYIKPEVEELFCDNELILCVSNSGVSQGIGSEDPDLPDQTITTDPGKNPFDD